MVAAEQLGLASAGTEAGRAGQPASAGRFLCHVLRCHVKTLCSTTCVQIGLYAVAMPSGSAHKCRAEADLGGKLLGFCFAVTSMKAEIKAGAHGIWLLVTEPERAGLPPPCASDLVSASPAAAPMRVFWLLAWSPAVAQAPASDRWA